MPARRVVFDHPRDQDDQSRPTHPPIDPDRIVKGHKGRPERQSETRVVVGLDYPVLNETELRSIVTSDCLESGEIIPVKMSSFQNLG